MGVFMTRSFFISLRLLGVLLLSFIQELSSLSNALSLIESAFLRSRLETVKIGIQNDYSALLNSALTTTDTNTDVTFIFPGAGGVDELILELGDVVSNRTCTSETTNMDQRSSTVQIIDWKGYRGSILTAAYEGEAAGESIAEMTMGYCNVVTADNNSKGGTQLRARTLHFLWECRWEPLQPMLPLRLPTDFVAGPILTGKPQGCGRSG
jgi:hypothetical protein